MNHEVVRVVNLPDVKERFLGARMEPIGDSPEQFAAAINSEIAKIRRVIKDAGIKTE